MSHTAVKDFEIVIVGGGVCGLACAIALAREGIPTEVYEAAVRNNTNIVRRDIDLQHLITVEIWRDWSGHWVGYVDI